MLDSDYWMAVLGALVFYVMPVPFKASYCLWLCVEGALRKWKEAGWITIREWCRAASGSGLHLFIWLLLLMLVSIVIFYFVLVLTAG